MGGEGGVCGLRRSAGVKDMTTDRICTIYLAIDEMPLQAFCKSKELLKNISKRSTERGQFDGVASMRLLRQSESSIERGQFDIVTRRGFAPLRIQLRGLNQTRIV